MFENVKKFLSYIAINGVITHKTLLELKHETNQAVFLFNKDISDYIDSLYNRGLEFLTTNRKLHGEGRLPVGEERSRISQEDSEHLEWLLNQFEVSVNKFSKYMKFDEF